ncbi:universal stress protein [Aquirhabdus sp.]|uniref:universal stress protein n=1 Tax=Aquirhabdus sp. TaxID=2824160 RepID=UPI00396C8D59
MYKNIFIAIDGSATSDLALREALKFAMIGAKLTAVTVLDNPLQTYNTPDVLAFNFEEAHAAFAKQAEKVLENAQVFAEQHSQIKIQTQLIDLGFSSGHDDIARAILKSAEENGADLIVIGTHGRRGIKRLFLGSVAEQLVRRSQRPVLLIRNPAETSQESS